jgi:hypothetical protein
MLSRNEARPMAFILFAATWFVQHGDWLQMQFGADRRPCRNHVAGERVRQIPDTIAIFRGNAAFWPLGGVHKDFDDRIGLRS